MYLLGIFLNRQSMGQKFGNIVYGFGARFFRRGIGILNGLLGQAEK